MGHWEVYTTVAHKEKGYSLKYSRWGYRTIGKSRFDLKRNECDLDWRIRK